jgi:DNA-binding beta-propeller fold protein YncE
MKPVSFLILLVLLCAVIHTVSAEETYVFTGTWGTNGSGDGQFNYPQGIAVDNAGNIYVADNGNKQVQKFTSNGTFVTAWGTEGPEDDRFSEPSGIAVDDEGNVYVTDTGKFRVQKFTPNGTLITEWGTEGTGDGQFYSPNAVAVDGEGSVYVTDIRYSGSGPRIQKFTSNGEFITKWMTYGDEVTYSQPMGIAADSAGSVYVVDLRRDRILKFTSTGTPLLEWGTTGSGDGQFNNPMGIAVDSEGSVYVTEPYANRVQKFTSNGTFVTKWGTEGSGDGQFNNPRGLTVDSAGTVYVVDSFNHRVQMFKQGVAPTLTPTMTATPTSTTTMNVTPTSTPDGNDTPIATLTTTTFTPSPTVISVTPQTTPYGAGNAISGRIEAENFDTSGTGAADASYADTTPANEGGAYRPSESVDIEYTAGIGSYDVGWIRAGEYLIYTVQVANTGQYTMQINAANPDAWSKAVDVYVDGTKFGTAQIGRTGSFTTFTTFAFPISLSAGTHQIKLAFPSDRLNLDYIAFAQGDTPVTTVTTSPPTTGSATFIAVPATAPHGSAFAFSVTPSPGKFISSAWWSFDYPVHWNTWNSRGVDPTFFYPWAGTYSPHVKLTYTDGTTEEVTRDKYITST